MTDPSPLSTWFDLPLRSEATVTSPAVRVSELLTLRVGSVIATRRAAGENIDLFVGDAYIESGSYLKPTGGWWCLR